MAETAQTTADKQFAPPSARQGCSYAYTWAGWGWGGDCLCVCVCVYIKVREGLVVGGLPSWPEASLSHSSFPFRSACMCVSVCVCVCVCKCVCVLCYFTTPD